MYETSRVMVISIDSTHKGQVNVTYQMKVISRAIYIGHDEFHCVKTTLGYHMTLVVTPVMPKGMKMYISRKPTTIPKPI